MPFRDLADTLYFHTESPKKENLLSTPMGVDYVGIGFDMEVQPLVPTMQLDRFREHYLPRCRDQSFAFCAYAMSAVGTDVMSVH